MIMDEGERHAEECALIAWREEATAREQVALISIADVAARAGGVSEQRNLTRAATLMVQAIISDLDSDADTAWLVVVGAVREARQRAGLPVAS
jgi:hypothetical protein